MTQVTGQEHWTTKKTADGDVKLFLWEKYVGSPEGKLVFDQASLAEVAREFNRYNTRQLLIDDETAGQIRLGGAFDARNVEGFARLLHTGFGLQVRLQADHIKVASPAR